jgi:hypothetical protein
LKGGRFFGCRVGSASSGAYYFSEHVVGALDEDLACALYGGYGVHFSGAIPWLGSKEGKGWSLACFTGVLRV